MLRTLTNMIQLFESSKPTRQQLHKKMPERHLSTYQPRTCSDHSCRRDISTPSAKPRRKFLAIVVKFRLRHQSVMCSFVQVGLQRFPTLRTDAHCPTQGLMYHPHLRPLTTPLAVLLDISSRLHHKPPLGLYGILPSSILRSIASRPQGGSNFTSPQSVSSTTPASAGDPSSLESLANLFEVPPIHVDQVADAIVEVIRNRPDVRGPVGVEAMRNIIGWRREGEEGPRYTKVLVVVPASRPRHCHQP